MAKKIVAFLTLLAFLYFNYACYTFKKELAGNYSGEKGQGSDILGVITKSGKEVKFSKDRPGSIIGNFVIGPKSLERIETKKMEIPLESIQDVIKGEAESLEIITKDGKAFHATSVEKGVDKIICIAYEYEKVIPLAECETILVEKVEPVGTFFAVLGGIAGFLVVCVAILASQWHGFFGGHQNQDH